MGYCIGVDVGTSGVRAAAIEKVSGRRVGQISVAPYRIEKKSNKSKVESNNTVVKSWIDAVHESILGLPMDVRREACRIAVDGTSATAVLVQMKKCDYEKANVNRSDIHFSDLFMQFDCVCPPLMYNESPDAESMRSIHCYYDKLKVPPGHTVRASTSTLSKLMYWDELGLLRSDSDNNEYKNKNTDSIVLAHQVDVINHVLTGEWFTDENNALKLGYDPCPTIRSFSEWLNVSADSDSDSVKGLDQELMRRKIKRIVAALPDRVVAPGEDVSFVLDDVSDALGITKRRCTVTGGTTDSIAAFLAAGTEGEMKVGEAVTSLGSTLAIKLISEKRIDDSAYGVYSHRLNGNWLVGGASNTGGAVLRKFFTDEQLLALSPRIGEHSPSNYDFYPLTKAGERFPINDPNLQPRLDKEKDLREGITHVNASDPDEDSVNFLHGILEGIAAIEKMGYDKLHELGCNKVEKIVTCGGGAKNVQWTNMRARMINVPIVQADSVDACVGSAKLAKQGLTS